MARLTLSALVELCKLIRPGSIGSGAPHKHQTPVLTSLVQADMHLAMSPAHPYFFTSQTDLRYFALPDAHRADSGDYYCPDLILLRCFMTAGLHQSQWSFHLPASQSSLVPTLPFFVVQLCSCYHC